MLTPILIAVTIAVAKLVEMKLNAGNEAVRTAKVLDALVAAGDVKPCPLFKGFTNRELRTFIREELNVDIRRCDGVTTEDLVKIASMAN